MPVRNKTRGELLEEIRQLRARLSELEKKPREAMAAREDDEYRAFIDTVPDIIYTLSSADETITSLSSSFEHLTGWPRSEWLGKPFAKLVHPEDLPVAVEKFQSVLRGETPPPYELRILTKSGSHIDVEFRSAPQIQHGKIVGELGIARDITERKRLEETIRQLAYHDTVTGLPNRLLFNDRFNLAMAHARRNQQKLAIMLLDLDHFKNVNDGLGHNVGDRLLKAVGERLQILLRRSDTIARLGGDEFMLLLPELIHTDDAEMIAGKVLEGLRMPFEFGSQHLRITTSIGIAIYPYDGQDTDALTRNADIAMYAAKEHGRDNYQRYAPAMNKKAYE